MSTHVGSLVPAHDRTSSRYLDATMSRTDQPTAAERQVALDRVRRRVAAIGFFAVAEHGVLGLIVVAHHIVNDPGRRGDAIGLLIMAGVVSALTYIGVRMIVRGRLVSSWILVAAAPPIIGSLWVL